MVLWRGLAAPADAVEKLEAAVNAVVAGERFKQASERIGCLPAFLPVAELAGFIAQKDQEIASIMAKLGSKRP